MEHDVFISYSRKDFDEVNAFVKMLKSRIPQLSYWFDIKGIESGDEFTEKIISAIDNSSYVIFMFSDNSIASPWTKKEAMYAKNIGKKIVPVLLKHTSLKGWFLFEFGNIDCIDSTNQLQVDKLIDNLCDWTGKAAASSDPNKAAPAPAVKTYKVGDYYNENGKEGIVFEVDSSGRHGKIIGIMRSKERLQWCIKGEIYTPSTDETNGMKIMQKIMRIYDWRRKYPAFAWCTEQGEGWYLPTTEEVRKIPRDVFTKLRFRMGMLKQPVRDDVGTTYCWTSSDYNSARAYCFFRSANSFREIIKSDYAYVRAVSAF